MAIAGIGGCEIARDRGQEAIAPEFVLTYAENQPEDYPTTLGAYRFAQLVNERTGGKVEIQINAGGVLGEEQSTVAQMKFGGIDFARVSISSLSDVIPKLNVLQMPYLYTGRSICGVFWKALWGRIF